MIIDYKNTMTDQKISVLLNTIEQMSADADDKGETSFGMRLTLEDAYILTRLKKVARGYWIPKDGISDVCSECGMDVDRPLMCCEGIQLVRYEQMPYCPWCGSKNTGEFIYDRVTGEKIMPSHD